MGKASRRKKSQHTGVPCSKISSALADLAKTCVIRNGMSSEEHYLACLLTSVAWNLSLLPPDQRAEDLRRLLHGDIGSPHHPAELFVTRESVKQQFDDQYERSGRNLVNALADLIECKEMRYPDDHRFIVRFDLSEDDDCDYLTVHALPESPDRRLGLAR